MRWWFYTFCVSVLLSCARVGSPIGGDRDSIAPKFLSANIDTSRVNVSRNIKQLRLNFDEYVTLKEINKNLIISPPIEKITKILPSNLSTKFVLIEFSDTLQANTTYNFNFGNSIVDNNEANVLPYFNFAFSTGEKLDDIFLAGDISDALSIAIDKESNEKTVVGLYQEKDSINYQKKPYYITKVDADGYYELNYLSPGKYRILAFEDKNGNSVFEPGEEKVAFQNEILDLEKSLSKINLNLYPSKAKFRHKESSVIQGGIEFTFSGQPKDIRIKSLSDKLNEYKVYHKTYSDTVRVWMDPVAQNIAIEGSEKLEFAYDADGKKDTISIFYKRLEKNEMLISNEKGNKLEPLKDFEFKSNQIIKELDTSQWILKKDSITDMAFDAKISKNNPYIVTVKADYEEGHSYQLTVPKSTVKSFYDSIGSSYRFDFEADKIQNYGVFNLHITNAPSTKFWTRLLNDKGEVAYSNYGNNTTVKFNLIKPGEYYVILLVDENENEFYDVTDFEQKKLAEKSYIFYKKLNIRPLWEVVEDWDLTTNKKLDPNQKTSLKPILKTNENQPSQKNRNLDIENTTNSRNGLQQKPLER